MHDMIIHKPRTIHTHPAHTQSVAICSCRHKLTHSCPVRRYMYRARWQENKERTMQLVVHVAAQ